MTTLSRDDPARRFLEAHPAAVFEPGDVVIGQGSESPMVAVVERGLVKGIVHPRYGAIRSAVLTVVGPGHWLGLESISERHNIEYRALTDARVRRLPRDLAFEQGPRELVARMLEEASWVLARTLHLNYTARLPLERRVLSRLCDLRESCEEPEVHITHEDLASLVGVHRNRIGETLRRLEQRGLVACGYREIALGSLEDLHRAYRGDEAAS